MDPQRLSKLSAHIVDSFFSDRIVPSDFIQRLLATVSDNPTADGSTIAEAWDEKNTDRKRDGADARDIDMPLLITRGYDPVIPEDELAKYLPEEKILINRDVFRKKLDGLDFAAVDVATEKGLLDELNNESIGLSPREVNLYYSLIKVSMIGDVVAAAPAAAHAASADGSDPRHIMKLFEENVCPVASMAAINDGKHINRDYLTMVIKDRITKGKVQPRVLAVLIGDVNRKYITLLKEFLTLVAQKWGDDPAEINRYFGMYLAANGGDAVHLRNLQLSVPLLKFITDELGRVKSIYYASIVFIMTFMYVLVTQIYEVSKKFHTAGEEQKVKILKLYNSEERIKMIMGNAMNIASQKILNYRAESRDVLANIQKFLAKHKDIVTANDLFKMKYD
ncbi:MAG: hypothetical protein AABZ39_07765 [Spirochaetota bacterium]